ncbi:Myb proto-oncogene protein [Nosema bombycis CQ1]|uniref:Myb proto-oncogene protein n=1 Tax=Nosema bombycis (strain CQ1 / CVCC 102059) TaxID=578461 RepID=R0KXU5_NOSB1|nr:Myb proto-oncogene protein [Nosema bombycis CQ1]|eukprot:EOB15032.1 Myb proto-oncogene protein [Nosema bombycis CQ1]
MNTTNNVPVNNTSKVIEDSNEHKKEYKVWFEEEIISSSNRMIEDKGKQYGSRIIKGPWTKEEDSKLIELIEKYAPRNWSFISKKMGTRLGKQCRERWHNHLNPNITKKPFSIQEDMLIVELHKKHGNKWSEIAKHLPGRTDNAIKNYWNSSIARRTQKSKRNSMFCSIDDFHKNTPLLNKDGLQSQNFWIGQQSSQKLTRSSSVTIIPSTTPIDSEGEMDELDQIASSALLKLRTLQ